MPQETIPSKEEIINNIIKDYYTEEMDMSMTAEQGLKNILKKHLGVYKTRKHTNGSVDISPYDIKGCKCGYLPFKDNKYCGNCGAKIKWID